MEWKIEVSVSSPCPWRYSGNRHSFSNFTIMTLSIHTIEFGYDSFRALFSEECNLSRLMQLMDWHYTYILFVHLLFLTRLLYLEGQKGERKLVKNIQNRSHINSTKERQGTGTGRHTFIRRRLINDKTNGEDLQSNLLEFPESIIVNPSLLIEIHFRKWGDEHLD